MHNMRHFLNILQLMSHYSELENHCKEMEVEINGDFAGKIFAAPGTQTHNLPTLNFSIFECSLAFWDVPLCFSDW